MKKSIITIVLIIVVVLSIEAHEQAVHQYITDEAYTLLKNYVGFDISQMMNHLENGPVGPP